MNKVELAEHLLLVSMFIDSHRPDRRYMSRQDFEVDYNTSVDTRLFNSIVADLREQGLVKASPNAGSYFVRLHSNAYKIALQRILTSLDADVFEIDWETKRIVTDAEEWAQETLIPGLKLWVLLSREKIKSGGSVPIAQSSQVAGRDINHFYGAVAGPGVINKTGDSKESWWTRWSTVFGGLSALLAILAILATWYFWRYPHP
ncbi:hypothetical protein [Sphingomonas sp. R1]|uniref:hypothetical protein n=1 Tax=Sphingomonas sp. R1 TaxID=399176 RepID=UPI002224F6CD|nr:hypothetical protein [Sphingomonas sp. R1]UYY77749.1 hypothetical protein OIM94_01705 [Sphingomonas sp. R1]